jgi:hypothetical protein
MPPLLSQLLLDGTLQPAGWEAQGLYPATKSLDTQVNPSSLAGSVANANAYSGWFSPAHASCIAGSGAGSCTAQVCACVCVWCQS